MKISDLPEEELKIIAIKLLKFMRQLDEQSENLNK